MLYGAGKGCKLDMVDSNCPKESPASPCHLKGLIGREIVVEIIPTLSLMNRIRVVYADIMVIEKELFEI